MIAPVLIWLILCEHKQLLFIFICTGNHPFYGYHLLQVDRYLFIGISSSLSQPRSPMLYIYISTSAKQAWQTHTAKGRPHLRHICIHVSLFPGRTAQKFLTCRQKAQSFGSWVRHQERKRETATGCWERLQWGCISAFGWVSIIQAKRMGSWPLKSTHGKRVFAVNINISVCVRVCGCARVRGRTPWPGPLLTSQQLLIMNRPAEWETGWWICRAKGARRANGTQVSDPSCTWSGRTWPGCQSLGKGQATWQGLLGLDPKYTKNVGKCFLLLFFWIKVTWSRNHLFGQ